MATSDNGTGSGASAKRTKLIIIGVSALLVVVVLAITAAIIIHRNSISTAAAAAPESPAQVSTSSKAVKALCEGTQYKDTCANSLSSVGNLTDPNELIRVALQVTVKEVEWAMEKSKTVEEVAKEPMGKQAVENCKGLMGSAIEDLKKSFTQMGEFDIGKTEEYSENLQIWLTAATTFQRTCLDGFENTTGDAADKMKSLLKTSMELTTNALGMVHNLATLISSLQIGLLNRRLLSSSFRRLLQAPATPSSPNVVVAQDGSGKYKTLGEALKDIPLKGATPFVIYIKEGVYKEYITITPSMTNVVMIGDGPTKTKITGNKNFKDGVNTFNTATFAVEGNHFTAKNIGFENTAGAEKHQAVAVRAQGDYLIFHNCHFEGYQDTLYAHAHRQFYRDCTITGTVDFIFGDAAVVFQNSKIIVRKPLPNQQCLVTASGRSSDIEASGIVIQNSVITGEPGLDPSVTKTYMGRPWRAYARTVVMESQLDALVHPDGWLPWNGDFGLDTLFYAEYANRGPGSATANRVKWAGVKTLSSQDVLQFTPGRFLLADQWIQPSGVPYASGMALL